MNQRLRAFPFEAVVWLAGLSFLALTDPDSIGSICPLHQLGFDFCPGCGLGESIQWLFRGELRLSLQAHPLGLFALAVLSVRIFSLIKTSYYAYGQNHRCTPGTHR